MTSLQGLKVLELAESVAGEYCGKLLADFGADIIKIEKPGYGSPTRRMGPFAGAETGTEHSGLFAYLNTGKRSVELDLSSETGREIFRTVLAQFDAVIDDHGIEWLRELELDAETVQQNHRGLVVCSISNFGLEPPEDRRHAEDINVFHSSGWGYHTPTGADPAKPPLSGAGRFLPSYEAGIEGAMCMIAALYERANSTLGQFIEISKQEVLASRIDYVLAQMVAGEMNVSTERTAYDLGGPAGIFPCKDGYIYIWLSAPAHWEGLRQLLDDTTWMAEFPDNWLERECTPERVALCRQHLVAWLKTQSKHDAAEKAQKLGVTLVAVNNAQDLVESPQYQFREFFVELEHPQLGIQRYPTVPYRLSATPARPAAPAPLLGQHNEKGLREGGR
ncbi:MAG TPA: CoA transferase [Dongiaceae bacterium]|nr:CoA transferase [Dongiaceae bacterium]